MTKDVCQFFVRDVVSLSLKDLEIEYIHHKHIASILRTSSNIFSKSCHVYKWRFSHFIVGYRLDSERVGRSIKSSFLGRSERSGNYITE